MHANSSPKGDPSKRLDSCEAFNEARIAYRAPTMDYVFCQVGYSQQNLQLCNESTRNFKPDSIYRILRNLPLIQAGSSSLSPWLSRLRILRTMRLYLAYVSDDCDSCYGFRDAPVVLPIRTQDHTSTSTYTHGGAHQNQLAMQKHALSHSSSRDFYWKKWVKHLTSCTLFALRMNKATNSMGSLDETSTGKLI